MTIQPVWEQIFSSRSWGMYPPEDLIRFMMKYYKDCSNKKEVKVLEVGCGPGPNLWYLMREGFQVYGIDGSPKAIEQAIHKLYMASGLVGFSERIKVGDLMASLPWESQTMDVIVDNEAIYCNPFEDSQWIYGSLWRVAKKGGHLYSKTFSSGCWGDGTGIAVGSNYWQCTVGPLAGKGLSRFTSRASIPALIYPWVPVSIDEVSRTIDGNPNQRIIEWVIDAIKH